MASKRLKKQSQKERTDRYKFQIYEQPKNEEHRYIRLTHYMLQHKNYQKLSVYAKVCYNYMRDWAWGKNGKTENIPFEYSYTMLENIGVMSKSQTIRSIKELRVCGFITLIARNKGETSKYIFSQRWFVGGNENYEIQDYYGMNK